MVGILSLQGDFEKHKNILDKLEVDSLYVKNKEDLRQTRALIIPGGESTTLSMLIDRFDMRNALCDYAKSHSIFGTCAGLILMSKNSNDKRVENLNIIDVEVERNGWGRQIDSFSHKLLLQNQKDEIEAVFIRAPKIKMLGKKVEILAK